MLLVEIQDVQPFEEQPWGFTGVFHKENGGGFLDQLYPDAYVNFDTMYPEILLTLTCLTEPRLSGILKESFAHLAISRMFGLRDLSTLESWGVLHQPKFWLNGIVEKGNSLRPILLLIELSLSHRIPRMLILAMLPMR